MSINLKGFTVLITGGSSGMGFEMAKELLSHGATVVIGARGGPKLDNAYEKLAKEGYDVYAVPLDVRDEESVTNAATWFNEHFNHLDMLINNAGIGTGMESNNPDHQFYDIPVTSFKAIVETNFIGYFLVSRAFVPMMVKNGGGRVVNVSTSTSTMTRRGMIPYGPSRAAAETMSTILSEELHDLGIMVNVICPGGFTETGMTTEAMREFFHQNNLPILTPDVMNKTILFLASPKAEGLTGEKIIGKEFDEWLKSRNISFKD
ncbi:SDR family NAD(P)-dependent oxidoreductase [Priestia endophytica]|uniref:SDR family NAD(P)-dependent oxidoreductase n=1 Tax=Priestia endophytica TaxID=135735 RepID=UPI000DCA4C59|nr:SDR family oxidoreductase [Priestia endophytica]RAS80755.1 hypothetical protein A4U60_14350 [Priestia endophytica]